VKIINALRDRRPSFSFEFFPPKSDSDSETLLKTAEELNVFSPTYMSVTWGAGGSTRRKTMDIVSAIQERLGVTAMAHLTCVGTSRDEMDKILEDIHNRKIENI
jgi:methylenetetrahydrofolate reductase (NADPH)